MGTCNQAYAKLFAACIKNTAVQTFDLRECWITLDQQSSLLETMRCESQINNFTFKLTSFENPVCLKGFISALEFNQIEILNLPRVRYYPSILHQLFEILPKTCIKHLSIIIPGNFQIDNDMIANLNASKVENLRIQSDDLTLLPLFNSESLKIKALDISSLLIHNDGNYNELMKHLTHLHINCYDMTLHQFEMFMIQLINSQVRSAILRFPLTAIPYWHIMSKYLAQCNNLIEFGYDNGSFHKCIESDSPQELALISALKQSSSIRYLLIDNKSLNNIAVKLRNTNIIRIHCTSFVPSNISKAVANSQITHITVGRLSILENTLIDHQPRANMSVSDCPFNVMTTLRNNELIADKMINELEHAIYIDNGICYFKNDILYLDQLDNVMNILYKMPGMKGHISEWMCKNSIININYDKFENMLIDEYVIQIAKNCYLDTAIAFLKRFEKRKQDSISMKLLEHRPVFLLNNSRDVLHPYVYILLNKYNMIIYQKDMEPDKKQTLIDYFTINRYGESDQVIDILLNY